ncbi:MAG: hypothetical protein RRY34_04255, partial [Victivallaceae bacterium]
MLWLCIIILGVTGVVPGAESIVSDIDPLAAERKIISNSPADFSLNNDDPLLTLEDDIVPPEEVVSEVKDDLLDLHLWFKREKHALVIMLVKVTVG